MTTTDEITTLRARVVHLERCLRVEIGDEASAPDGWTSKNQDGDWHIGVRGSGFWGVVEQYGYNRDGSYRWTLGCERQAVSAGIAGCALDAMLAVEAAAAGVLFRQRNDIAAMDDADLDKWAEAQREPGYFQPAERVRTAEVERERQMPALLEEARAMLRGAGVVD